MAQILVYASEPAEYAAVLREAAPGIEIAQASTRQEALAHLDAEILLSWGFPPDLLASMPRLRWVQWLGAGVDKVIGALAPDVPLTRIVGGFGGVMTEHVFAFLLAIRRDVFGLRGLQREHRWQKMMMQPLRGQRLGVAGLGSIGADVARMGRAFGMEVWGLSRTLPADGLVDRHFLPGEVRAFVAGVQNLALVLPATTETDKLFGSGEFAAMQEGTILVNVGRGNAIDEAALAEGLRAGRPAYAQLDVFQAEPLPAESPLWDLENCFISAHCSGPSEKAEGLGRFTAENLRRYLSGEPLLGLVDRTRGY